MAVMRRIMIKAIFLFRCDMVTNHLNYEVAQMRRQSVGAVAESGDDPEIFLHYSGLGGIGMGDYYL